MAIAGSAPFASCVRVRQINDALVLERGPLLATGGLRSAAESSRPAHLPLWNRRTRYGTRS